MYMSWVCDGVLVGVLKMGGAQETRKEDSRGDKNEDGSGDESRDVGEMS